MYNIGCNLYNHCYGLGNIPDNQIISMDTKNQDPDLPIILLSLPLVFLKANLPRLRMKQDFVL
jgi:hypothetical protein